MFAEEISGSINDKFNSTEASQILQFRHLLTWLKIRVNAAEQGAGESWGKVKRIEVKTEQTVKVDLGTGLIFENSGASTVQVKAFAPDPDDPVNPQQYKDLEPATPEDPQIASILVVPDTEYEITYLTEEMNDVPETLTVKLHDFDGNELSQADDAKNNVFVITLSFYEQNKVEAQCTLEPMTDEEELLYGKMQDALFIDAIGGTFTYSGSAYTPGATVRTASGGTTLNGSTDYDLFYSDNTNAGTASVTAVGKGTYAGRVGTRSFTIDKALGSGTISFDESNVMKTYGNAAFTNSVNDSGLTWTGAGTPTYTLSYTSSDEDVATVDASSGQVTIVKPGTATITANVDDGDNHYYEASKPSDTFYLTVKRAPATITFASASLTQTYSPAGTVTNALTNTGDGTVSYASSDESVATVAGDGTVTIQKAGTATITATVADDGVYYQYAASSTTYGLTVEKANATISYATTAMTRQHNDLTPFTNTLTYAGDGAVSYSSSDTNVATVNPSTGEVTLQGSIGTVTITATIQDGTNYTYSGMSTYQPSLHQATVTYTIVVEYGG